MAIPDQGKLAELLAEITVDDAGLAELLDGMRPPKPGLTDPDELPPEPDAADVYVKRGDLWLLGEHRLLCRDATNPADVARLLDGAQPRLLATDPPYGVQLGR